MSRKDPVSRSERGFRLALAVDDRRVILDLIAQLRDAVVSDAENDRFRRLFPAAYHADPDHDAEYRRLMHGELLASRLDSLNRAHQLLGREEQSPTLTLDEDEIDSLMKVVNDLRLVLGTLLDVQEDEPTIDEDDPAFPQFHLYSYLGWLLEWIIRARNGN
jgi:hypothetical protein